MAKFSETRVRNIVEGARVFRVVPFPSFDGSDDEEVMVAVRLLSDGEIDACRMEAQQRIREWSKKRGWEPTETVDVDPQLLQRYTERAIVARAFFDPDTISDPQKAEPFFRSSAEVAELSSVQVTSLMAVYIEHQQWVSPWRTLDEESAKELADALGKAPDLKVCLAQYERDSLLSLCITLVSLLRES